MLGSNSVLLLNSLTFEKVLPIEILRQMQVIYGDQCVDVRTVRCWVRQFICGEEVKAAEWFQKHQFFKGWILKTSATLAEVH